MGDASRSDGVVNVTAEGEQLSIEEPNESRNEPNAHVFNEQTNYVPKRTIITVSL